MLKKIISSVTESTGDCLKPYKKLPAPIHEKAVAPCPPTPSAQLSLLQPQKYLGTEGGSHETLSHADLRCGGLQEKPETCVLQYHKRILFSTTNSCNTTCTILIVTVALDYNLFEILILK
jgi:hypothetical protein